MISGLVYLIEQVATGLYIVFGVIIIFLIWRWVRALMVCNPLVPSSLRLLAWVIIPRSPTKISWLMS